MKIGFDNDKYLAMQSEHIRERIKKFDNKLYLEFGGKLFDDYHASRVLPGFQPDSKLQMLLQLKEQAEIVIVISAEDIISSKVRGDYGITYDLDVLRLIDAFQEMGLYVGSVCVTKYTAAAEVEAFEKRLSSLGIRTFRHYKIPGYPNDVARIVSDEGYGRNEYIETERPLVVITAPGPGSGKMAVCLSQLYHEYKRGVKAGYAKFPEASGQSGLRGRHRRPERCEHDRPLPSGSLRRDHRELQPRHRDLPGGERDVRVDRRPEPL